MSKEIHRFDIQIGYDDKGEIYLIANDHLTITLIESYVNQIKKAVMKPYVLKRDEQEMKINGI